MASKKTVKVDLPYAVHVGNDVYGPGEGVEVPEDAAREMHARHFEDGKHPFARAGRHSGGDSGGSQRDAGTPPPRSGAGSGADEWRAYAAEVGVEVGDDAGRDEVIDAIAAAGKPVDPQQ